MAVTQTPFTMDNVSLTLKLSSDAVGPAEEYRCQLSRAELVPSAATGGGGELSTFCATYTQPAGNASWTLNLEGFQQYTAAKDLSMFLFDNEGQKLDYELTPMGGTPSASNPGFSGTVTATPTAIGGTAKSYATMTVALVCDGKPTKVVALAAGAGVEGTETEANNGYEYGE